MHKEIHKIVIRYDRQRGTRKRVLKDEVWTAAESKVIKMKEVWELNRTWDGKKQRAVENKGIKYNLHKIASLIIK